MGKGVGHDTFRWQRFARKTDPYLTAALPTTGATRAPILRRADGHASFAAHGLPATKTPARLSCPQLRTQADGRTPRGAESSARGPHRSAVFAAATSLRRLLRPPPGLHPNHSTAPVGRHPGPAKPESRARRTSEPLSERSRLAADRG